MTGGLGDLLRSALDPSVALVEACGTAGDAVAHVAANDAAMVIVLIGPAMAQVDRAMLLAAIGPIAAHRAPQGRIAALDVTADADPNAVLAAAHFLARAHSTTGQVVRIAAD